MKVSGGNDIVQLDVATLLVSRVISTEAYLDARIGCGWRSWDNLDSICKDNLIKYIEIKLLE